MTDDNPKTELEKHIKRLRERKSEFVCAECGRSLLLFYTMFGTMYWKHCASSKSRSCGKKPTPVKRVEAYV